MFTKDSADAPIAASRASAFKFFLADPGHFVDHIHHPPGTVLMPRANAVASSSNPCMVRNACVSMTEVCRERAQFVAVLAHEPCARDCRIEPALQRPLAKLQPAHRFEFRAGPLCGQFESVVDIARSDAGKLGTHAGPCVCPDRAPASCRFGNAISAPSAVQPYIFDPHSGTGRRTDMHGLQDRQTGRVTSTRPAPSSRPARATAGVSTART